MQKNQSRSMASGLFHCARENQDPIGSGGIYAAPLIVHRKCCEFMRNGV